MKKVIFLLSIIMFFKTSASNYERKIYDLSIESISGEVINFKDYKNKVILVVNTASYGLQTSMRIYKNCGIYINQKV